MGWLEQLQREAHWTWQALCIGVTEPIGWYMLFVLPLSITIGVAINGALYRGRAKSRYAPLAVGLYLWLAVLTAIALCERLVSWAVMLTADGRWVGLAILLGLLLLAVVPFQVAAWIARREYALSQAYAGSYSWRLLFHVALFAAGWVLAVPGT